MKGLSSWAVEEHKTEAEMAQDELMRSWGRLRVALYKTISHNRFDAAIGLVIAFNLVLMLIEADGHARIYPDEYVNDDVMALNRVMLAIYTVEAMTRGFVQRSNYFSDWWNILDFTIVAVGWLDELMAALLTESSLAHFAIVPMLRILRVARLARAVRLLRFNPELYVMVKGFFGAMRAMFWGFALIIFQLVLWSLICVEIVHPINMDMMAANPEFQDEFCKDSFSSVAHAALFFFKTLVAGDSWGTCTVPIIEYNYWTFLPFALALVSVSLGFMNLILAVIVDHACKAREGDKEEQIQRRRQEEQEVLVVWKDVFMAMDVDGDGLVSMEEMNHSYSLGKIHDKLNMMGLDRSDLQIIFDLLDRDHSGDLDYEEFLEAFYKAGKQDLRVYLMMSKLHVESLSRDISEMKSWMPMNPNPQAVNAPRSRSRSGSRKGTKSQPLEQASGDFKAASVDRPKAWHSEEAAPESAPAASFEAEVAGLRQRLQEQFESFSASLDANIANLGQHAKTLRAAPSSRSSSKAAASSPRPLTNDSGQVVFRELLKAEPPWSSELSTSSPGADRRARRGAGQPQLTDLEESMHHLRVQAEGPGITSASWTRTPSPDLDAVERGAPGLPPLRARRARRPSLFLDEGESLDAVPSAGDGHRHCVPL